jgi:hypothetical protein
VISALILVSAAALIVFADWDVPAAVLMAMLVAGIALLLDPRATRDYFFAREPNRKRSRTISWLVVAAGTAAVTLVAKWDLRAAVLLALLMAGLLFLVSSRRMR